MLYPLAQADGYEGHMVTARRRRAITDDSRGRCGQMWNTWSPSSSFVDADFEQAAEAGDNPESTHISVHAYLHPRSEAPGEPAYQNSEHRSTDPPAVRGPTLVLHGE
ncbi:hypothetical protein [Streptomyces rimosus]|uniref:hypothetical protein n=1 Tax=Streptomyces rimosus TaxID=1927 RepID=UPI00311D2E37